MTGVRVRSARFLIGVIALTVSVASLVGCAATGAMVPAAPPWWEAHLTLDRDLHALGLRELGLTRSRSESGFLRVTGEYVNRSDAKLSAIYRFTWLDASGQPVESILGGWQAVHNATSVAGDVCRHRTERRHSGLSGRTHGGASAEIQTGAERVGSLTS